MNNELNYFLEKPITIITNAINRNFNETQSIDYFTGICEKITEYGVFSRHPITNCKNFIFFSNIVGIFEEQKITDEEINKIKNDQVILNEKNDQVILNEKNKIDINNLTNLIEED